MATLDCPCIHNKVTVSALGPMAMPFDIRWLIACGLELSKHGAGDLKFVNFADWELCCAFFPFLATSET